MAIRLASGEVSSTSVGASVTQLSVVEQSVEMMRISARYLKTTTIWSPLRKPPNSDSPGNLHGGSLPSLNMAGGTVLATRMAPEGDQTMLFADGKGEPAATSNIRRVLSGLSTSNTTT